MDDGLLRELIDLQKEENQLLKKYLWRLRFSLLSLLLLTTATAIGLGFLVYEKQAKIVLPAPTAPTTSTNAPTTSTGTYQVWSSGTLSPSDSSIQSFSSPPSATFDSTLPAQ